MTHDTPVSSKNRPSGLCSSWLYHDCDILVGTSKNTSQIEAVHCCAARFVIIYTISVIPLFQNKKICSALPTKRIHPRNCYLSNAMRGQNINLPVCVSVCVSVTLSVNSPTGQSPQRIFTANSLQDAFTQGCAFWGSR